MVGYRPDWNRTVKILLVALVASTLGFAAMLGVAEIAYADGQADAGPSAAPSDDLADPTSNPGGTVDDVKRAWSLGWAVGLLVAVRALLLVLGRWVPWLRVGKRALLVAGATAVLSAAFDSLALGGNAYAALWAAASAAFWYAEAQFRPKAAKLGVVP